MKKIYFLFAMVLTAFIASAQTPVTIVNGDFSLPSGATSDINNVPGWKSDDANSASNTGNNYGAGYMTNLGTTGAYNVLAEVVPLTSVTYTLTFDASNTYPSASGIATNWIITFSHLASGAAGTTRVTIQTVSLPAIAPVNSSNNYSAQVTIPALAAYAGDNLVIGFDCKTPSDNINASWINMDNFALTRTDVTSAVQNVQSTSFKVYPNPATKYITTQNAQKVTISDLNGRIVKEAINTEKVDVSLLAKGAYIVKVKVDNTTK